MIIEGILLFLFGVIKFVFGLFTLPAMPLAIIDGLSGILQFFSIPIGVIRNYVGDSFFIAIFVVLLIYVALSPTIYFFIWLYQRIRG